MLAHHADDQAETLLMRLASGSGITGLTGMKETTRRDEILILRPLLRLPAMRLRATVDALAIPYVDDPSNQNDAFQRVRLRKARAVLRAEGLTSDRLAIFAKRMARADDALKILADRARRSHEMPFEMGHMFAPTLFDEPHEIILRVLHASILQIGSGSEPMLYRLEDHVEDLVLAHSLGKSLKLTLGGAILAISADGRLKITSESPRRKV